MTITTYTSEILSAGLTITGIIIFVIIAADRLSDVVNWFKGD